MHEHDGTGPAAPAASPLRIVGAVLLLVLVAVNLRPAFSSLGPVLNEAVRDTGMSPTMAGVLTTLPVLCLGLFALLAPRLERAFGMERTVCGLLAVLAAGTALRGVGTLPALLAGGVVAGAAIGVGGVLLPSLVKRDFPGRASLMTGVYTMALSIGAAGGSGLTAPLAQVLGGAWSGALALWALPALLAALVWLLPALRPRDRAPPPAAGARSLWRDPLAWQVTLFMGLQSSLAYIVFAWLAPILRDRGLDPVSAGLVVSVALVIQIASSLVAPSLATRGRGQSRAVVVVVLLTVGGLLGTIFAPLSTIWLWALVLGLGQGSLFAVSLLLIVLRAPDSRTAARLSGMAQSVGYVLGAAGPFAAGLLHDHTGGWDAVGALLAAIGLAAILFGTLAGRDRRVGGGAEDEGAVHPSALPERR